MKTKVKLTATDCTQMSLRGRKQERERGGEKYLQGLETETIKKIRIATGENVQSK